jgi:hypothetical protein
MEPTPLADQHSIWKVLPLHPRPERLESMTSYMIRLAEANGLRSMKELVALVGIPRRRLVSLYDSPDYPAPSYYEGLAQITGCPEERLLHTTFLPLLQRFGRSMHPRHLHRFLAGSLASSLRYCPSCLAECSLPYYSLLWRFLVLPGCIEHGGQFLDQCGHCGSLLPLLSSPPRCAKCPTCQGDLRTCQQRNLDDEVLSSTRRYTQALSMLLSPMPAPLDQAQAKVIGKQCMALRQERDLSITEVAKLSGEPMAVIMDIEQVSSFTKANFADYIRYVDALSCSLLEVFDPDRLQESQAKPCEDLAFKQVEAAIQQLMRQGEPVTRRNVRNLVGTEAVRLGHSPQIERLLAKYIKGQGPRTAQMKNQREEELVKQMKQAIEALEAIGTRVSQRRICDLVGMNRTALMRYPRANALLKQIAYSGPPPDLQRLAQDAVEQAQASGISIGYRSISEMIGISIHILIRNSQVRVIIQRAQNEIRELRVNDLVSRVEHAIEELVLHGKKVSVYRVSKMVGMDRSSLDRYPQIRELFSQMR